MTRMPRAFDVEALGPGGGPKDWVKAMDDKPCRARPTGQLGHGHQKFSENRSGGT